MQEGHQLLSAPPSALFRAASLGLASLTDALRCWEAWAMGCEIDQASLLADHLEGTALELGEATAALSREAAAELERREDAWRPLALQIAEWLPGARTAIAANARLSEIKEAENWWKETVGAIRDERFSPVADRAVAIWRQLRLRSNVDLESIELEGTAQRRKATLRVTVDGTPAQALGVMSQGELHALALSLFLPRATLAESPFRFLWIDDPVTFAVEFKVGRKRSPQRAQARQGIVALAVSHALQSGDIDAARSSIFLVE